MTLCVEMTYGQAGGLAVQGPSRDWQDVLDTAAAIRLVHDADEAEMALYEIEHATGDVRLYLVQSEG